MPELGPPIEEFRTGTRVERVPVQVLEATAGKTKDSKPFARYTFRDRTGTVFGVRWDYDLPSGESGALALVTGQVSEYQQKLQLKVSELRLVDQPERELLERVVAPRDEELTRRLVVVLERAREQMPQSFWRLFEASLGHDPFDTNAAFWTHAAAQSRHHACRGGLAWHVLTMLAHVEPMAVHYPGLDRDLLMLGVLLHDLGKIDCYRMNLAGAERLPLDSKVGHTAYGIARVHRALETLAGEGLAVDPRDVENLLHCIASHHGRPEWGALCEPQTPEAQALHALDLLDSQIRGDLDRAGRRELPDRGAPAATPRPAPAGLTDDPFLVDDDDPFEDDLPAGGLQGSLFDADDA